MDAIDIELKALLEARRGDWVHVAEGSGISHSWISQFMRGKIPNPGYVTLRTLRCWLEANPAPERAKAA